MLDILQYRAQIIETIFSVLILVGIKYLSLHIVRLTIIKSEAKYKEQKEVSRLVNLILVPTFLVVIASIWVLQQNEILLFISSLLTVLGVGFFAEWSILSNVTAYLVLFFSHPIKIGDRIKIQDNNQLIEGTVNDITYFFVFVINNEGQEITIPNAIILKSSFSTSAS
jgi:small-conductance mechanosensitive channel